MERAAVSQAVYRMDLGRLCVHGIRRRVGGQRPALPCRPAGTASSAGAAAGGGEDLMGRFLIPLAAFAVLIGFLGVGLRLNPHELPSQFIGKSAPEFSLP